jgi:type 1 glutamine amidotransferase
MTGIAVMGHRLQRSVTVVLLAALALFVIAPAAQAASHKKIVLVAGKPSHGPGEHEFNAGVLLLKKCLDQVPGLDVVAITNGWPTDPNIFDGANAIVLYMDGGNGHPAIQDDHLTQLAKALQAGAGLACLHYAVEVPKDNGGAQWLNWIGGYFETYWSVNPMWLAHFDTLPKHPITRGVKPFSIYDEWYYHMRFQPSGVTPILNAVPPDETRDRPDDAHGGNQYVRARKGLPEVVAWAYKRSDGGRGFGFTGAHFHKNWANEDFRKLVLNAIVWTAKGDVPHDGIKTVLSDDDLTQNLDPKHRRKK